MLLSRSSRTKAAHHLAAVAVLLVPSAGVAADISSPPLLRYNLDFTPAIQAAPAADPQDEPQAAAVDPAALECMAKVVHHESRNQPRKGQLAVAQTLLHRLHSDGNRFGDTICAIANQPGQYFKTSSYHPTQDGDWQEALDVARATLEGSAEDAAPGALYFHAAYRPRSGFFRSRQRVASIGDQIFYR